MKKLQLNKKTIQTLNKEQMQQIDGGLCLISCASGSRKGKACCDRPSQDITITPKLDKDGFSIGAEL
ncbi:class I lanthipeptide [Chryseobacterium indoltheticum]|uniref:Uncharacterized protein n=1 Tax=Chryseobacterium indoltheticum TaxID=254 RepID=A0A381FQH8_9FLAO|nr:class I lanthipeptide [Chryseobacterium indoltheticum]AZA63029.1 hypothetical protein EG340_19260 [Chryseobacterium indoltheticum]SUX48869.1 Uncharacterised protein [Chryseobacterium indoltheticum]